MPVPRSQESCRFRILCRSEVRPRYLLNKWWGLTSRERHRIRSRHRILILVKYVPLAGPALPGIVPGKPDSVPLPGGETPLPSAFPAFPVGLSVFSLAPVRCQIYTIKTHIYYMLYRSIYYIGGQDTI